MSLGINTDDFWKDRAQKLEMALADTEALEAGTAERCRRWRESHKMSQLRVVELTAENARLRAALSDLLEFAIDSTCGKQHAVRDRVKN